MAFYKGTWLFELGRVGWSESWYLESTTIDLALTAMTAVAQPRVNLCGVGVTIVGVRVSEEGVVGDSRVEITAKRNNLGNIAAGFLPADQGAAAILCRVSAGDPYKRQFWLRGIQDEFIVRAADSAAFVIDPLFLPLLAAFKNAAVGNGFRLRALSKEGFAGQGFAVTNLVVGDGGKWSIVAPGNNIAAGDKFRVKGCKGVNIPGVNGVWQAISNIGGTLTIPALAPLAGTFFYQGGGRVLPRIPTFFGLTDIIPVRPGTRRTGRAFFVPVGRRLARR